MSLCRLGLLEHTGVTRRPIELEQYFIVRWIELGELHKYIKRHVNISVNAGAIEQSHFGDSRLMLLSGNCRAACKRESINRLKRTQGRNSAPG
jgi:hypothetical protein